MTYEYMRGNGTGEATTEVFYTYDELHQVVTAKENYGNKSRSYQYDSLGNLTLETNSNNVTVDYKLNNLNQITTSSDDGWKTSTAYSYDKRGNLIQELYTKGKKQSVTGAYTFDETNKMVKGVNDLGESSVYLYNGLGALVEQTWTIKKNSYGYHDGSETVALTAQEGTETESGADAEAQAAAPTPDAGTTLLDELDAMGDPAAALDAESGIMPLKNDHSDKKPDDKPGHKPNQMITVVKQFFPDYTRETLDSLVENEVGGLEYRYVYGNERLSVNITGIENGTGSIMENGNQVRLYYHQDLRGTVDYLTSPVSQKIESWTHYNEWGEITHNAVLKCGQRQLDLVKNYTGHEYDSVLGMYYAKARFYDAENRKFISLDPIMDSSRYDVSQYATTPAFFVQYLYVKNSPLVYIDPMGLMYDDIVLGKVPSLPQTNSIKSAAAQKPVLTLGKTGNDVYNLQKILIDAGYYHYTDLDGSFGPKTYAAVQEFQRANGLQVDGSVGPQTWTVILGGQYVQGKDTQGRYSDQRQLNNELKQTRTLVNMRVVSTTSMSQKDYIELDSRLRHALDATVNTVLPYIQNMIKYAVQEPRKEDYQALADHPEQRAARFSSQYHIPLIPEQSTLLQLDSVLRSIRPENLHELRDVFHANYETMIDMAAFYGMLFVKRARHYSMGWAPLTPPDDPYYHLLTMPEIERFVVLETGESDPRPGVRSDVLSFVIQAWNHMGLKWSTFSSLALL